MPPKVPVLEVGCGVATESIFMASMGWRQVFAIDNDEDMVRKARAHAKRRGVKVTIDQCDLGVGRLDMPSAWPQRFGIVLDRLVVNNFHSDREDEAESADRREYFARVAELLQPNGILVIRDRLGSAEATFRRALFEKRRVTDFLPKGMERYFFPLQRGRILPARLVGDDTSDHNRLDAMIPIQGVLAILRRSKLPLGKKWPVARQGR